MKGWHLYHNVFNATTQTSTLGNGANGHARTLAGPGSGNSPGFWAFNSASSYSEKALGAVSSGAGAASISNASTPMRIGLEMVNNTGGTLTQFTVTYDGEQYLDGRSATPGQLQFAYSLNDTAASYAPNTGSTLTDTFGAGGGTYTRVAALDFTAPTFANSTAVSVNTDGNLPANRVAGITSTVTGISWAPGTSLFLQWNNIFLGSGNSDGLSIDNVSFSATVPEPTSLSLALAASMGLLIRRRRSI